MNAPAVHRAPAFVALGGGAFRGAAMVARPAAAAICGAPVLAPVTAAPLVVVDGLPALGGDVTMRCRRNLKLEKRARNRANGRTFKKSKPRFFNRRSAVDTTTDKDTEFLSSIFNVLTFDARSSATTDDRKKGGNKDPGVTQALVAGRGGPHAGWVVDDRFLVHAVSCAQRFPSLARLVVSAEACCQ
ncbi:hypothetical protein I4F81_006652 [Pyropia yezoensis]|uniref:Uncharacterized protein n=1 Tax=Pyropia yezoensis TaxID=2788 RepID=A0ACC3C2S6_PYRYE|nr:hypothetical protein I4F81_006652 [Neopyropia yezoensis]